MFSKSRLSSAVAGFLPAYFSLVMATGIVSIASHLQGFDFFAFPLFWLNLLFYGILWAITGARIIYYPMRFLEDVKDHVRGVGCFTIVAGTCVLGSQFVILLQSFEWGVFFLGVGTFLWVVLIYGIFTTLAISPHKPSLEKGIHGGWLVAVVATQSISVLVGLTDPHFDHNREAMLFFSLAMFLMGGILYLLIIFLILYRFLFFVLKPEDLKPQYWVNMGAAAISALAGAVLALNGQSAQFLAQLKPFVLGLALFFWASATWWIPYLFLLGVWRYLVRRVKFSYEPHYWSLVFPLGMYTTCTTQLAKAVHLDFLMEIPRYFIYAAILAWGLTFWGLLRTFARFLFSAEPAAGR